MYQNKFSVLTVEEGVDTQDCDEVPVRLDATDNTECDRNVC